MLNEKFFTGLLKDYISYNRQRHEIIKRSSDILRNAKQAIFALHRGKMDESLKLIKEAEAMFQNLEKAFETDEKLRYEGAYQAAKEEYVEAKLFCGFLKNRKVEPIKEVQIGFESYLGGICDLTGEMVRKAIALATAGKFKEVKEYREATEKIMEELIKIDMTGKLRCKFDDLKRNLRKMEEICYDIKIKRG